MQYHPALLWLHISLYNPLTIPNSVTRGTFQKTLVFERLWTGHVISYLTSVVVDFTVRLFALRCRYGEIESIRVLHERFCAFVNFKNASMAARAMEKLNVRTFRFPSQNRVCCWTLCWIIISMLSLAGSLYWEHAFSGEISRPSHSEGPSFPTEDLSPCHTAGRGSCWVSGTSASPHHFKLCLYWLCFLCISLCLCHLSLCPDWDVVAQ